MWGTMIPINRTIFGAVYSTLFICTSCGFAETWIERNEDLQKLARKLGSRES